MPVPDRPRHDPDQPAGRTIAAGLGVAVLLVVCCAAPVLLAAGVLGAVGAWLSSPWVIGAAVTVAVLAVVTVLARHRSRPTNGGGQGTHSPTTRGENR